MNNSYKLNVYNVLTGKYENVPVSEELYRVYKRSGWNIEDNNTSFFDHEIQFSQLIGGDDGAYENFHEFISDENATTNAVISSIYKELLYKSLASLRKDEADLINALFFDGKTEREYSAETGIPQKTVNDRKQRILVRLKKLMNFEK